MTTTKKGFTLIELLIVIGILAILATTVVLVLNPAQILAESRDTQRISDLGTIQTAVGLMLATDVSLPVFGEVKNCTFAVVSVPVAPAVVCSGGVAPDSAIVTANRTVAGLGWVAIDLTGTSGGASVSTLPMDPTNTGNFAYIYDGMETGANPKTYEINARLESTKLALTTMANDGGNDNACGTVAVPTLADAGCWYEIGTSPSLALINNN